MIMHSPIHDLRTRLKLVVVLAAISLMAYAFEPGAASLRDFSIAVERLSGWVASNR